MIVRCGQCGGPLDVHPHARVVRCSYCGHSSKVAQLQQEAAATPAGWQPPATWTPPAHVAAPSHQPLPYRARRSRAKPVLLVLAAGLLLGVGGYAVRCAVSNERTSTLRCNGSETSTYEGLWVEAKIAVRAEDRCQLTLRDCHLYGEMTSVQANGHAKVRLESCSLRAAIRAWDDAEVTVIDSTTSGGAHVSGHARVRLQGGEIRDGRPQTLWAGDDSVVQVDGTRVEGRVDTAGKGRVLGMESR